MPKRKIAAISQEPLTQETSIALLAQKGAQALTDSFLMMKPNELKAQAELIKQAQKTTILFLRTIETYKNKRKSSSFASSFYSFFSSEIKPEQLAMQQLNLQIAFMISLLEEMPQGEKIPIPSPGQISFVLNWKLPSAKPNELEDYYINAEQANKCLGSLYLFLEAQLKPIPMAAHTASYLTRQIHKELENLMLLNKSDAVIDLGLDIVEELLAADLNIRPAYIS